MQPLCAVWHGWNWSIWWGKQDRQDKHDRQNIQAGRTGQARGRRGNQGGQAGQLSMSIDNEVQLLSSAEAMQYSMKKG